MVSANSKQAINSGFGSPRTQENIGLSVYTPSQISIAVMYISNLFDQSRCGGKGGGGGSERKGGAS